MNANIYIFSLLLDFVSASHEIPAGTWRQETLFLTYLIYTLKAGLIGRKRPFSAHVPKAVLGPLQLDHFHLRNEKCIILS